MVQQVALQVGKEAFNELSLVYMIALKATHFLFDRPFTAPSVKSPVCEKTSGFTGAFFGQKPTQSNSSVGG